MQTAEKHGGSATAYHGFSLMEMLVVISLITLLIAMLMPSLSKSKESARRVKCMTQQRSMQQMCDSFSVDNAELLPDLHNLTGAWGDNTSSAPYWFSVKARDKMMASYGLVREICYCPSNQEGWNRNDFWDWPGGKSSVWGYFYFGGTDNYYPNSGWTFSESVGGEVFANAISSKPQYRLLFADLNRQLGSDGWYGPGRRGMNHVDRAEPAGSNHIFLDGHGEWVPWQDMNLMMFSGSLELYW